MTRARSVVLGADESAAANSHLMAGQEILGYSTRMGTIIYSCTVNAMVARGRVWGTREEPPPLLTAPPPVSLRTPFAESSLPRLHVWTSFCVGSANGVS